MPHSGRPYEYIADEGRYRKYSCTASLITCYWVSSLDCPHGRADSCYPFFDLLGRQGAERQPDGVATLAIGEAACAGQKGCAACFSQRQQLCGAHAGWEPAPDEETTLGPQRGNL